MIIEVVMPLPHSVERLSIAVRAIERHTNRPFLAKFAECSEYCPNQISVFGIEKGVGQKTWEKWTTAVRVAIKNIEGGQNVV